MGQSSLALVLYAIFCISAALAGVLRPDYLASTTSISPTASSATSSSTDVGVQLSPELAHLAFLPSNSISASRRLETVPVSSPASGSRSAAAAEVFSPWNQPQLIDQFKSGTSLEAILVADGRREAAAHLERNASRKKRLHFG